MSSGRFELNSEPIANLIELLQDVRGTLVEFESDRSLSSGFQRGELLAQIAVNNRLQHEEQTFNPFDKTLSVLKTKGIN